MEKVPGATLLREAPGCINDLRGDDGHTAPGTNIMGELMIHCASLAQGFV